MCVPSVDNTATRLLFSMIVQPTGDDVVVDSASSSIVATKRGLRHERIAPGRTFIAKGDGMPQ
jgi:hypothetical protein